MSPQERDQTVRTLVRMYSPQEYVVPEPEHTEPECCQ